MHFTFSSSAREARMIHLFKEIGSNAKTWWVDGKNKYIVDPIKMSNYPKAAMGVGAAAASAVLEFPDYIVSGIIDQKLEPPSGTLGRTRRDIGVLLKDVVTLRPLRSLADASRLVFTDIPMDTIEAVTGLDGASSKRVSVTQKTVQNRVARTASDLQLAA